MTALTIALGGDVMTGRGVDQALAHPGDPETGERNGRSAADQLAALEARHGPVGAPLSGRALWGDAPAWLESRSVALRIVNLETAVTTSKEAWPDKRYRFRMHPANVDCLSAAGIDCCTLANNHVLDWGTAGLTETLATLAAAGIHNAGAGQSLEQAARPAILHPDGGPRVLVFSAAHPSSLTPRAWAATGTRAGVNLLGEFERATVAGMRDHIARHRAPGDLVIASLHWGPNYGYEINLRRRWFARALLDQADVHVVHGHSSHHPIGLELHRGRPILYGCGDLINDYATVQERYRNDLGGWYVLSLRDGDFRPVTIEFLPRRRRGLAIVDPTPAEVAWLAARMSGGDRARSLREAVHRLRHLARSRFASWTEGASGTLQIAGLVA